jgi:hypothetical protein
MRYTIFICCLLLVLLGCTTLIPPLEAGLSVAEPVCYRWLENIESTLEEYRLNDPETVHINGFPHLRVNRFLASMGDRATSNDAFADWLEHMRQLDSRGKKLELANLPTWAKERLVSEKPIAGTLDSALAYCGKHLNKVSLHNPAHKKILLEQAKIPDAYQSWKRIVGLYPLVRFVATASIERLHSELEASFKAPLEKLSKLGKLTRYSPPDNPRLTPEQLSAMMKASVSNPLGIPSLTFLQLQQLSAHFAPIWEIDTRNDTDKIGTVVIGSNDQPHIDISLPTVYVSHSYNRWHGNVLLQLIYQVWLPAREKTGLLDLYGGSLDSVIWRVTLDPEGTPIAYDSIHACGCYYLFFPAKGYRAITPKDGAESVLSPKSIVSIPSGQHLLLRLQSRTHYLQQVSLVQDTCESATRRYLFQDLGQLRSLPKTNGTKRSLYGQDGIVDASARTERFLLWPFGIANPGAMRQWGTHAIAFIGRRHFDDPFLLEKLMDKE